MYPLPCLTRQGNNYCVVFSFFFLLGYCQYSHFPIPSPYGRESWLFCFNLRRYTQIGGWSTNWYGPQSPRDLMLESGFAGLGSFSLVAQ